MFGGARADTSSIYGARLGSFTASMSAEGWAPACALELDAYVSTASAYLGAWRGIGCARRKLTASPAILRFTLVLCCRCLSAWLKRRFLHLRLRVQWCASRRVCACLSCSCSVPARRRTCLRGFKRLRPSLLVDILPRMFMFLQRSDLGSCQRRAWSRWRLRLLPLVRRDRDGCLRGVAASSL